MVESSSPATKMHYNRWVNGWTQNKVFFISSSVGKLFELSMVIVNDVISVQWPVTDDDIYFVYVLTVLSII